MARLREGDKLVDIQNATIAEVVGAGFSAASVKTIVVRANVSVGTIYRYYANKEDSLRVVYIAVKTEVHSHLTTAVEGAENSEGRLRSVWYALLEYATQNPNPFLYSEFITAELVLSEADSQLVVQMGALWREMIDIAIKTDEVAKVVIDCVQSEKPALRMRTSEWSEEFSKLKTASDPDGTKLPKQVYQTLLGKS